MGRYEDILWYTLDDIPEATIYPLADVHLGAIGADTQAFYELITQIASEPNSYVTLQGDLIDNGTRNSVTNIFKATMPPSQQIIAGEVARTLTMTRCTTSPPSWTLRTGTARTSRLSVLHWGATARTQATVGSILIYWHVCMARVAGCCRALA